MKKIFKRLATTMAFVLLLGTFINVPAAHAINIYNGSTYEYKELNYDLTEKNEPLIRTDYWYSPDLPSNATNVAKGNWVFYKTDDGKYIYGEIYRREVNYEIRYHN